MAPLMVRRAGRSRHQPPGGGRCGHQPPVAPPRRHLRHAAPQLQVHQPRATEGAKVAAAAALEHGSAVREALIVPPEQEVDGGSLIPGLGEVGVRLDQRRKGLLVRLRLRLRLKLPRKLRPRLRLRVGLRARAAEYAAVLTSAFSKSLSPICSAPLLRAASAPRSPERCQCSQSNCGAEHRSRGVLSQQLNSRRPRRRPRRLSAAGTFLSSSGLGTRSQLSRQTGAPSALGAGAPPPRPPLRRWPHPVALPPPPRMSERSMVEWRIMGNPLGSRHPSDRCAPVRPCAPLRSWHVGSTLARRERVPP